MSQRTTAALATAKDRGVRSGVTGKGRALEQKNAEMYAAKSTPMIDELWADGHRSFTAIARELNIRRVPSFRGELWYL